MNRIWETLVRWRTWFVNAGAALLILLPELLNAPEVMAVIPAEYRKYAFVAALILNIIMRPRPAVMAKDPEVFIAKSIAANDAEHA
jgi:ABC-type branched-subunit amino acid transport system permease subunit